MTHIIIVRRDISVGSALAMATHAAGESFYELAFSGRLDQDISRRSQEQVGNVGSTPTPRANFAAVAQEERVVSNDEVGGANPSSGSTLRPEHTVALVFGARNENKLRRLERELLAAKVPHVAIREPDCNNELMAIGLVPGDRETLRPYVRDFNLYPH